MSLFMWSSLYEVGFADIDEQHKKLMGIANRLHDARMTGQNPEIVDSVLAELLNYTKEHFEYESRLLERQGYEKIDAHRKTHDLLLEKIVGQVSKINNSQIRVAVDVMSLMRELLISHFLNVDKIAFGVIRSTWEKAA